ncbi:MAG: dTDP-glucose 4,6-dehydratase [Acaryochloridaceae cyanobacterium CSU_5_19]|nr:dTDP-glucose 4,6-dehydratase [Acaryochloridaceae cyanobacterium CSU_5_19]
MTILVTGGAGFIGANFVLHQRQVKDGIILNLDKLTYAGHLSTLASLTEDPKHIFVQGDIGDRILLSQLLEQHRPQAILNFAAETHVDRSIEGPDPFIQTNILGTFNLLEAVRAYWQSLSSLEQDQFRFLQVSTDEVFGSLGPEDPPFSETTAYAPNSPYSASKASSDHLVRSYFHTYGLPTLVTNCSNNYGPYQFPEKLIPLIILNALEGKPLPIYGDGQNIRDWLFVDDHCRAIDLVLEQGRPGETYNIGGGAERTNLWLVQTLCALLDELVPHASRIPHAELMTFVTDRPGHDRRYAIDYRKLHLELGWSPQEKIESGLRKTVQWYLDHRSWSTEITQNQYQRQRLGLLALDS